MTEIATLRCDGCGGTRNAEGILVHVMDPTPDMGQLEEWVFDSVCEATDGCQVEPDGRCPHGHKSWLLVLGLI